jgi:DNA-binding response OmpR family regulator
MKVLVADDDQVSCSVLETTLLRAGYEVITTDNGVAAWQVLQTEDPPSLVILDWMMPQMDGLEVCRKIRQAGKAQPPYVLLLTARTSRLDIVEGLRAGGDDYLTKPVDLDVLHARLQVGVRMVQLQQNLANRVRELEEALSRVKQLQGLLPICSYCKKIRNDQNYWQQVEIYVSQHSDAKFSHSICPGCYEEVVKPELRKFNESLN